MYVEKNIIAVLESSSAWRTYVTTMSSHDLAQALIETFLTLDLQMYELLGAELQSCGSTAVVFILTPTYIVCANAGDSRCVLSSRGVCKNLSDDHKPNNPLESARIRAAGGYVVVARGRGMGRVEGILGISRGFGDFYLKNRKDLPQQAQKVAIIL
jgi:serine/threonine protein phosphatase PrpC